MDDSSPYYALGEAVGQITMVAALLAVLIWLAVRGRRDRARRAAGAPGPSGATPDADLATLGRFLTLHAPYELAASVVGRALAQHPLVAPTTGPTPAWEVGCDGVLYLTLVPTPQGAVLRVAEVEVPLRSPQAASVWGWVLSAVATEAASARLQTTTGHQPLAPARAVGPYSAIWAPAVG